LKNNGSEKVPSAAKHKKELEKKLKDKGFSKDSISTILNFSSLS
jgi:SOS response regulatory protein OraA/RecX